MQRYFSDNIPPAIGSSFRLDDDSNHHLFNVMRAKEGLTIEVVFDQTHLILAEVAVDHTLIVRDYLDNSTELPVHVTIASGLPKADKLEFLAQKITELGASQLLAFPAHYSVTKLTSQKIPQKTQRLEKIARGASQQAKRLRVPDMQLLPHWQDLLSLVPHYDHVLVAWEEAAKAKETSNLARAIASFQTGQRILVIFGPEGGLTPSEVDQLTKLGATPIGLGPRILRTETAPLYVLSAISYYLELF